MKRLSVIVPCYNVEQYIDKAIGSIVEQTLDDESYEIIIVDDASTDTTAEKIGEWEKRYPSLIKAVYCEENGRQGRARNIGLSCASGEYIGFVDSDDWIEPQMYETLLNVAYSGDYDVVICKSYRDNDDGSFDESLSWFDGMVNYILTDSEEKRRQAILNNIMTHSVMDKVIRKSLIDRYEIRFPEKVLYEDVYFTTLLDAYVCRTATISAVYYHYRVNQNSTVLKKNADYHSDIMTADKALLAELKRRGLWDKYHDELELCMLISWYLGSVKVMALRYDEPPFDMFVSLKNDMNSLMPGCSANKYIPFCMNEFYQLIVQLLDCEVTKKEFNDLMAAFKSYTINKDAAVKKD